MFILIFTDGWFEGTVEYSDDSEIATRQLIGDENYEKMVEIVDSIIKKHQYDNHQSFWLTTEPSTERGWQQLHKLLPGDKLSINKEIDCAYVYSQNILIGAIDYDRDLLDTKMITGIYVAQQECWGDSNTCLLKIIIYYKNQVSIKMNNKEIIISQN